MKLFKKIFSIPLNILLYNGLKNHNVQEKKVVALVNFYSFIIFLYVAMMGTINVIDKVYFFGLINLATAVLMLINLIIFRFIKNISLVSTVTVILLSNILFYTLITGGKKGTGLIWPLVFPPIIIQLIGLKKGTIVFLVSIVIQVLIINYPWLFNYGEIYTNIGSVFFRLILIQIFIYLITLYFITNRNELYNEIDQVNKQKISLFIKLAHETKTPITLITNYLDNYIKKKGMDSDLLIIKQNLDKLKRDMINYLDIEKLNRNEMLYNHNEVVNFSKILKLKVLFFNEIAINKKINIILDIPENVFIKIDPYAVDRIINNLLDNAIKYNKESGNIKVILNVIEENVELIIEDTGLGINKEELKYIFNPFYQSSNMKNKIQGIGMGLSIVKEIVDEVNGKIEVTSKINEGTKFKITFNLHNFDRYKNFNDELKFSKLRLKNLKNKLKAIKYYNDRYNIFVVEDNIEMLSFLQQNISNKYNFYYATNGKKAIEVLSSIPKPHVIISDILMDEMDGYVFYEKISNNKNFNSIPFIFLSAKNLEEDRINFLSKGAVDYITKPFSINELLAKINSILKYKEKVVETTLENIGDEIYSYLKNKSNKINCTEKENIKYDVIGKLYSEYGITEKELEIICLLKKGLKYKDIGSSLGISINTVRTYIKRIFDKCSVKSTKELLYKIIN